jgi:carboxymethylenebutenolidase
MTHDFTTRDQKNMDQRIINLYDEYTHKPLSRSVFLERLAGLTGSLTAAMTLLPLLDVSYASAQTIAPADDRIRTETVTYAGVDAPMKAYLAVVVIHENRGLNPHIEDVTRRLATAGFLAMAPDALSATGGTPPDETLMREQFGKLDPAKTRDNFVKAVAYLKTHPDSTGRVGCVGFCWGGAMANQLAVHSADMRAAVAFYGRQPDAADVPTIKGAVQLHYGGLDERVNAGIPAYEAALTKAGIVHEVHVYDGAQHAFHNDTAPTRYNETAAKLAWGRTLTFLKAKLG